MQKKWWFLFTCLDLSFRYCYIRPTLKNGRLQRCEASMLRSWNDASKFIDFCIACRSRLPKRRLLIQLTSYWNANEGDFSKKSRLPPLTISQTTQQTPDTAPPPGNASWERQQMQPERTKRCRKDAIWDSSRVGGILRPISSKRNWFCWCLFSVGWKWLKKISNQVLWFLWKGSETLKILCSCGHLGKNASWGNQACNLAAECVRLANENELDTKICTKRLLEELEKPTDIYIPSKILEERERAQWAIKCNQYQSRTGNSREAKKKSKKHWPRNLLFDASQTHGQIWFPWNRVSMRKSGTWSFAMPFGLGVRSFAGQMMPHFKWVGWIKALHFSTFLLDSSNKKWAKLWGQEFECSTGCGMQLVASSAHLLRLCWHAFFSSLWHVVRQEERGNLEQREQSVWLRNVSASLNPLCEHDCWTARSARGSEWHLAIFS